MFHHADTACLKEKKKDRDKVGGTKLMNKTTVTPDRVPVYFLLRKKKTEFIKVLLLFSI